MLYTWASWPRMGQDTRSWRLVALAMSAPVVLAGCLPAHPEAGSDVRPSNAHAHRLINQCREFGLCLVPAESGAFDPLQHRG
jgi:hypothetical protein